LRWNFSTAGGKKDGNGPEQYQAGFFAGHWFPLEIKSVNDITVTSIFPVINGKIIKGKAGNGQKQSYELQSIIDLPNQ
jgi:hypothetical protein